MRTTRGCVAMALAFGLQACGSEIEPAGPGTAPMTAGPVVVMISIDGLSPNYVLHADSFGLHVPNLRSMVQAGTYATGVIGVLPTVTYPSHVTLITGASPRRHGIPNNATFDPQQQKPDAWYWFARDIKVPTLWAAAADRGLKTANVHWPVSVGAHVDLNLPQYWRADTRNLRKLIRLNSTPGLLERLEQELGDYAAGVDASVQSDENRARFAERIIRTERPALTTVYLAALDYEQHLSGPLTAANVKAKKVLERIDRLVGNISNAAFEVGGDSVTVVVVSDHGFARSWSSVDLIPLLQQAGLMDIDSRGRITGWRAAIWTAGATIAIVPRDKNDAATRGAVRKLAARIRADTTIGVDTVFTAPDFEGRVFPGAEVIIALKRGFKAGSQTTLPVVRASGVPGTHGYLPSLPHMRAAFFMIGRGATPGHSVGEIDMRAIAPTVAQLLGVTLAGAELGPIALPVVQR